MPEDRVQEAEQEALSLFHNGIQLQNQGEYAEAESSYQKCLTMMKALGNKNGEAATVHYLATLLETKQEFEKAAQSFARSFELFEKEKDVQNALFSLFFQSILALKRNKEKECIDFFSSSLTRSFLLEPRLVQEAWARARQIVGVLFARREIDSLHSFGKNLRRIGQEQIKRIQKVFEQMDEEAADGVEINYYEQQEQDLLYKMAEITEMQGDLFQDCAIFWSEFATFSNSEEQANELLQKAFNLDFGTGENLYFTDFVAKIIHEVTL